MRTPGSSGSNQPTHGSRVYANQLKTFRDVEIAFRLLEMELAKKQKVTEVAEAPVTNITQNIVQNYTVVGGLLTIGIHSVLSEGLKMAWPIRFEFPTGQIRKIVRASIVVEHASVGQDAIIDIRLGKNPIYPWQTYYSIFNGTPYLTLPANTYAAVVSTNFSADSQIIQSGWTIAVYVLQAGTVYGGGEGAFISLLIE